MRDLAELVDEPTLEIGGALTNLLLEHVVKTHVRPPSVVADARGGTRGDGPLIALKYSGIGI
jgi:hypothetical protein